MKWCSSCNKICDVKCERDCTIYGDALPMLTEKEFNNFIDDINEDLIVLILSRAEDGIFYYHNEILEYYPEHRVWLHDWYEGEIFYIIGFEKVDNINRFHALTIRKGIFVI